MAATKQDISRWFDRGVVEGKSHLIVVCDTYDHDDYPVYVNPDQDAKEVAAMYNGKNMQRIMEVYSLSMDKEVQLNQFRAFNY